MTSRTAIVCAMLGALLLTPFAAAGGPLAYVPGASDELLVLDTATMAVNAVVKLGTYPRGVAVNRAGTRVYVTNSDSGTVSVVDTATNTVVATLAVGARPVGVAVHPDGTRVYAASTSWNRIWVFDAITLRLVTTIAVGDSPSGIAITPDGARLLSANAGSGDVSIVDTVSNAVIATVATGAGPNAIAFDAAGARAYVTNGGSGSLSLLDLPSATVIGAIAVGVRPVGVAVDPAGSSIYVANAGDPFRGVDSSLSFIDAQAGVVVASLAFKGDRFTSFTYGVAVTPDGSRIFLLGGTEAGTVTVVDAATHAIVTQLKAGYFLSASGNFIGPAAFTPAPGLWWNPGESGSGYHIDVKHGVLVLTVYSYSADGDSEWYIASGPLTANGTHFEGALHMARNGQCISCAYPGLPVSGGSPGTVTIDFAGPGTGTMTLPGGRVTKIQKQAF